jgi:hypothetical protein
MLHAAHAPASLINQVTALGPDVAMSYAQALAGAGPAGAKRIESTLTQIDAAKLAISRGAASAAYGGTYNTGAGFLKGLQSQQAGLNKMFAGLGRTMATEAVRWFNVPAAKRPKGYQHGGLIPEPVLGIGQYSQALYTFGEAGREWVVPAGGHGPAPAGHSAPLIGQYTTAYYGTGDAAEAMRELSFMLRRVRQGAFFPAGS